MEEFNVKNFIFSSSATVYGAPKYLPLDEKHPCEGDAITNPYGKSKYVCEHVLKDTVIAHPVCIEISFQINLYLIQLF
jgi:UDP-glucose 4-epimerase